MSFTMVVKLINVKLGRYIIVFSGVKLNKALQYIQLMARML